MVGNSLDFPSESLTVGRPYVNVRDALCENSKFCHVEVSCAQLAPES